MSAGTNVGTLLQRTRYQCNDQQDANTPGFCIDYDVGGAKSATLLKCAVANDIVQGFASGNSVHLTIYTLTGNIERDLSYGNTEEYEGTIFRVTVTSDPTVYIEFVLGPPPVTVRLQTIVPATATVGFGPINGPILSG